MLILVFLTFSPGSVQLQWVLHSLLYNSVLTVRPTVAHSVTFVDQRPVNVLDRSFN